MNRKEIQQSILKFVIQRSKERKLSEEETKDILSGLDRAFVLSLKEKNIDEKSSIETGVNKCTLFRFSTLEGFILKILVAAENKLLESKGCLNDEDIKDIDFDDFQDYDEYINIVNKYILPRYKDVIKRGDMTRPGYGYRNDNLLIFNGQAFIDLDDEPDDYGSVPVEFKAITEFHPCYWKDVMTHNRYIKVPDRLEGINVTKVEVGNTTGVVIDDAEDKKEGNPNIITLTVEYNGDTYYIVKVNEKMNDDHLLGFEDPCEYCDERDDVIICVLNEGEEESAN